MFNKLTLKEKKRLKKKHTELNFKISNKEAIKIIKVKSTKNDFFNNFDTHKRNANPLTYWLAVEKSKELNKLAQLWG
jgi:Asp-tRNA(Asn)/Glu-tRNA(Gln) amidotransferase B subunit